MQYPLLRDELRRLAEHFRQSAAAYPGLRCQRVWDANPVSDAGWDKVMPYLLEIATA